MTPSHYSPKLKIYHDQIEGTRGKQEDSAAWYEYPDGSGGCAIVADGIGGGGDGDKASKTVVSAFVKALGKYGPDLKRALTYANMALLKAKESKVVSDSTSCGCTLVAVSILNGWLSYISVGDSNIFLHKKDCVLGSHVNFHHSAGGSKITSAVTGYFELVDSCCKSTNQKPFDYKENFACFEPGDRLILASDGIDTYEPRRGCYDRLSNLLLKYPVGGNADVQTIVSHILHELENRVANHMEMARIQQWTDQKIKLIQDNATILMVEAWENEPASEPVILPSPPQIPQTPICTVGAPGAPLPTVSKYKQPAQERADRVARPQSRCSKRQYVRPEESHSEPEHLPIVEQTISEKAKQRNLLFVGVAAAVGVLGLFVVSLLFYGEKLKVRNLAANNEKLAADNAKLTQNQQEERKRREKDALLKKISAAKSIEDLGPYLQPNQTAADVKKQVEDTFKGLVNNTKDIGKLYAMYNFEKENFCAQNKAPEIVPSKVKRLLKPDGTSQFSVDFLKDIAESKDFDLWEHIVVQQIQIKYNKENIFKLLPKIEWKNQPDNAPESWKLFCHMCTLAQNEIKGLPSDTDPVWDKMGDSIKDRCIKKMNGIRQEQKVAKARSNFDEALEGSSVKDLLPAYREYLENCGNKSEIDDKVKKWLQAGSNLNYTKFWACAEEDAVEFLSLCYDICEKELTEQSGPEHLKKLILGTEDFKSRKSEPENMGIQQYLYDCIGDLISNSFGKIDSTAKDQIINLWLDFCKKETTKDTREKYKDIVRILSAYYGISKPENQ